MSLGEDIPHPLVFDIPTGKVQFVEKSLITKSVIPDIYMKS